jgi:hypothetical protein
MDQASILYRQLPGIASTNTQGKQWEDAGCFGVSGAQGRYWFRMYVPAGNLD